MKISKNKTTFSLTSMFLMITIAISMFAILPQIEAQTVTYTRSFMYVGVSPLVVGVGQEVIIVTWTADMPPDVGEQNLLIDSPNGRAAWNSPQTVIITKPDGTNETITLPRTDPVGATWAIYTPETVGSYSVQAYFPGEWKNNSFVTPPTSRYYTPDYSPSTNFTVTQDPTATWVETPLTNDYWTRPLNSANHEWYTLAGNWLGSPGTNYPQGSASVTSLYAYGKGTETPHILWTKQY